MFTLKLNLTTNAPKYRQIILSIEKAIDKGELKKGDPLPSINSIRDKYNLSRDTVLTAYNDLKTRGIIQSIVGKGYFVSNENVEVSQKIFVLFDELNSFKEELYNSFMAHLDPNVRVDIFFHHFNDEVFLKLISENNGNYNYYVIMPANLQNTELSISMLPENKVYILDQTNPSLSHYPGVYQNFNQDIFDNLSKAINFLVKYSKINLVISDTKQPLEMQKGFERFCKKFNLKHEVLSEITNLNMKSNQAYITPDDKDLLNIIKIAKEKQLTIQKDYGILSYNDTLLKELVEGGISTISTDFNKMGELLAQMIREKERVSIENPSHIIIRNSL